MRNRRAIGPILAIAGAIAASGTARAGDGVYLFGNVGMNQLQDSEAVLQGPEVDNLRALAGRRAGRRAGWAGEVGIEFGPGVEIGGGAGYGYDIFRVELGGSYAQAPIDRFTIEGLQDVAGVQVSAEDLGTDIGLFSATLDGYVDLPLGASPIRPFAGLGLAYTPVMVDSLSASVGGIDYTIGDVESDDLLTLRLHAGVSYSLNDKIDLQAGYRYAIGNDLTFTESGEGGDSLNLSYGAHSFGLGFRYALGYDPLRSGAGKARTANRPAPRQPPAGAAPASVEGRNYGREPSPSSPSPSPSPSIRTVAAPTSRSFAVQVVAVRDPNQAEAAWRTVLQRFPQLLRNARPMVLPFRSPEQGDWTQVWATGYDQATAAWICGTIQQAGQPCAVSQL